MRTYLLLSVLIIPFSLAGQTDTIIYYSGLGRSIDSLVYASFYEKFTKISKKNYLSTTFSSSESDEPWKMMYQTKIRKETDSEQNHYSLL